MFNAVSLEDPRQVLSIGFVDVRAEAMAAMAPSAAEQTETPRAIEIGSAESLLDPGRFST